MWELDHKEVWAPKNWWCQTVVLEKTLESPLDSKEIQPVHPKENQSWIFIGRADAEADAPILWPPDAKSELTGKDLDAGKIEDQMLRGRQRMRWLDTITNSWSLFKIMSIELVIPSKHLIFCHPLLLLPSIFPSTRVFSNESVLFKSGGQMLEFQLQHQSFQWIFRTDFL